MTAIPSREESDFAVGSRLIDKPSRTRRTSRAFIRYLIAIGIGVAGTLAWQSYGEAAKQTIAAKVPQLGWSPEVQQTIAGWVQELGWIKPRVASEKTAAAETTALAPIAADTGQAGTPQAAAVAQAAPEMKADTTATAAASLEQVQQMAADLAALHQTVEHLTAGQDRMARDIATMQAANEAILQKVTAPPPPAAAPMPMAHKHVPAPSTAAPLPLR
jgi:hypothetical protein